MSQVKDLVRDQAAGAALTALMLERGWTDSQMSQALGACSASCTVATWRKGCRPNRVARERLLSVLGFDWDAGGSSFQALGPEVGEPAEGEDTYALAKLLELQMGLRTALESRDALEYAIRMLERQVVEGGVLVQFLTRARELWPLVSGHRDPAEALRILGSTEDARVVGILGRMLSAV